LGRKRAQFQSVETLTTPTDTQQLSYIKLQKKNYRLIFTFYSLQLPLSVVQDY